MQPQINAIKQLLDTNNAIAELIDQCIVKWAGESASWEQAATFKTAEEFNPETKPEDLDPVFKLLWRSRIDLNDARINAEEVDLDEFLASLLEEQKQVKASLSGYLKSDEVIAERDRLIEHQREIIDGLRLDVKEKSRDISLLKTTIKGFEAALELANSKAIAPNLDAFKIAVDEAVNPALLAKIEECDLIEVNGVKIDGQLALLDLIKIRDREIEVLRDDIKGLIESSRLSNNVIAERDSQIQELQITVKNHREQFDNLKSHFEILLKAIAMNLNALKGARKPDETKEVNGVMTTFRNYDDNLTHHHKTIIIENVQRAIAEEAKVIALCLPSVK